MQQRSLVQGHVKRTSCILNTEVSHKVALNRTLLWVVVAIDKSQTQALVRLNTLSIVLLLEM